MPMYRYIAVYIMMMTLVVVASNILVQYPFPGEIFGIQLSDLLTYGAFIYPVAFLVTDLSNRQFGPSNARKVVFAGFVVGVVLSYITSQPRIAVASGTAYLVGQLLDISVFNQLRRTSWWKAPLLGSMLGSVIDTVIFFSLSFAPAFSLLGPNDDFAIGWAPLLGVFHTEAPRWISWAMGDLTVKVLAGLVLLMPYGALMSVLKPMPPARATA